MNELIERLDDIENIINFLDTNMDVLKTKIEDLEKSVKNSTQDLKEFISKQLTENPIFKIIDNHKWATSAPDNCKWVTNAPAPIDNIFSIKYEYENE